MMNRCVFFSIFLALTWLSMAQNTHASGASLKLSFDNGESHQFDAVVCRTDAHRVGNLMVKASVSAQGEIGGSKVVVFIDQSHPVGSDTQLFEDLQIWSTEISSQDLLNKHRNDLLQNLDSELQQWFQKEQIAIQNKFIVTNEMSPEEMIETTNKSSQAYDDLQKELEVKQTKTVRSFGKSQIQGNTIKFDSGPAGLEMFTRGEVVGFADLLGVKFSAKVSCLQ